MPEITELRELVRPRGIDKAAILMLSLEPAMSTGLMGRLEFDEIRELSQAMSGLGRIDSAMVEAVFGEFRERVDRANGVVGSFDATEKLLAGFLEGDRVEAIMEEIRGPAGRNVWEKLTNVNEAVLASYLKNEYPQTVAVVLSKIDAGHAARVLSALPDDFALEVIMRMLRMEVVQKDILNDVERTLRAEFMSNLAQSVRRDNHEVMAEIFNYLDRQTESRFISLLEERNKESADRIRTLMFTFEDLIRLDAAGVQTLIRTCGNERLGMALKGANDRLKELFFTNMSERGAKIMRDEMASMGPVRLKDVEEAQQFMVNTAKDLAASGDIFLADDKQDQMIY